MQLTFFVFWQGPPSGVAAVIDAKIVSETAKKLDTKVPGTYAWYQRTARRQFFFFVPAVVENRFIAHVFVFKNENRRAETRTNRT